MKAMIVLGLLLILLGIAILSYQWVNYRTASGIFESAHRFVP
jgi:hypothetical protein